MPSIQLYATGSATATSVAQITIPSAGRIVGIQASILLDSITDNGVVRLELSKVPTNQIATNGALDPIAEFGQYSNFVTSGLDCSGQCLFLPVNVTCRQGEIIYLHATVGGTATYYANFILIYG